MMRRKRLLIPILIVLLLTLIGCKDESVNYIGDYEEKEVLVKVEGVNRYGHSYTLEEYDYDGRGRLIESYKARNDDGVEERATYQYNDQDQLIKKIVEAGGFEREKTYHYDQRGNLIKEVDKRSRGNEDLAEFKVYYQYDGKDNLIEVNSYRDGELIRSQKYDYDQYGNKILEKIQRRDAFTGREHFSWQEWEYDERGTG